MSIPLSAKVVRSVLSAWPFVNGVGRIVDKATGFITLPPERHTCRTTSGFDCDVIASDHVGRHILLTGQFDSGGARLLARYGRAGDTILDIGANIGYVSCLLLASIPDSRVIAVEPNPQLSDILLTNLRRLGEERSEIVEAALSDNDGTAMLHVDAANMGRSSLSRQTSSSVEIRCIAAGRFLSSLDRLDLIKIDVEGHEETVLKASLQELARLRPRAILYEDQERKSGPDGAIGGRLRSIGYQIFGVSKSLVATNMVPIQSGSDCNYNDYVAVLGSDHNP